MDLEINDSSEFVYQILCEIIGNEDVVNFNRLCSKLTTMKTKIVFDRISQNMDEFKQKMISKTVEVTDLLLFYLTFSKGTFQYFESGSRAEGFNFQSSDYDNMIVMKEWKVIQNKTQEHLSSSINALKFLMEKENTRPGFVRLKAQWVPAFPINVYFIRENREYYLSNNVLKMIQFGLSNLLGLKGKLHGPCFNFTTPLHIEMDISTAVSSDTWPENALACIHRMLKRRWPSDDVIRAMVNDGCLFVPIGCKTSPHEDIEWRMSFSLAEKRLVHSMNHTQFLTYALLKLFLKEVVEEEVNVKGLLCSYFMKTSVFWEIIESNIPWNSSCLLQHFWNCYRRLLSWINNEYCPNFFIPENNMFHGKIYGHTRQTLLRFLFRIYSEGNLMLHKIPQFRHEVDKLRTAPLHGINYGLRRSTAIIRLMGSLGIVVEFPSAKIWDTLGSSQSNIISELIDFLRLSNFNLFCYRKLCLQSRKVCDNRIKYRNENALFRLIKASSPDCVRSKIFMALHLYRCKRYDSSVCLLHRVIRKIENEDTMYMWELGSDKYSSLGGDALSVSEGMYRYCIASAVPLDSETCIPEISEECSGPNLFFGFQLMAPLVLTYFLLFLCHFWKKDLKQARQHLRDIRNCLKYQGHHISNITHIMSWELLGIGQEIIGDFQHALISFGGCERHATAFERLYNQALLHANKERITRIKTFFNMQ